MELLDPLDPRNLSINVYKTITGYKIQILHKPTGHIVDADEGGRSIHINREIATERLIRVLKLKE